jgi:hypothetical protein
MGACRIFRDVYHPASKFQFLDGIFEELPVLSSYQVYLESALASFTRRRYVTFKIRSKILPTPSVQTLI